MPPLYTPEPPAAPGRAAAANALSEALHLLRPALRDHQGRIAVVSSFGADSAVLLALVAELDPAVPILFLDTLKHFPETLRYQRRLAAALGLRDVRRIPPEPAGLAAQDPSGLLHTIDADSCCALRKVAPLEQALTPFDAWITGRRRHQAPTRTLLPLTEQDAGRLKLNPLAAWTAADMEAEMQRRDLPRHPLALRNYPSIGCAPCTRPVQPGADPRSGRWAAHAKTECGIHRPTTGHAA